MRAALVLAAITLFLEGCGRANPATVVVPSPSPTAVPTPASVHPVSGVVFYDENGNGVIDDGEDVRLPHVVLTLGGRSAESDAEGSFAASAVPAGTRTVEIRPQSLPPQFRAGRVPTVAIPLPEGARVPVPVVLPIGANRPNTYLAFGDSITAGDGSRGSRGYRSALQSSLRDYWGRAEVVDDGVESTRSDDGAARIAGSLAAERPAYVLILYGTNDWNLSACHRVITCFTIENTRSMIRQAKAAGTIPVVSTIIPVNPAYVNRLADERNFWVDQTNAALVPMARAEGAIVADLNAAMRAETPDLPELFSDHVHPNDRGYSAMADAFFRALTQPVGAAPATPAFDGR
ncbi:MAG TPA: SGNH/GDSL hydrolase family protein [Vicinamibacteria bacterium]|nr:SGNH/GDSL hydrolase family protein [Vicinamibacteria bacterium]